MNRDWIKLQNRKCKEYKDGVNSFLEVAKNVLNEEKRTRCPCQLCLNLSFRDMESIEAHLYTYGMSSSYSRWIRHGEKSDFSISSKQNSSVLKDKGNSIKEETEMVDILNHLRGSILDNDHGNTPSMTSNETGTTRTFEELLDEAQKQLYPGCTQFSTFNYLVRLMHLKVLNNWSNRSFDLLLQLLREAFPDGANLPASFFDAKKRLRQMGLGYKSIHACKYDCILFWKEYEQCEYCPMCGESRYKVDESKGKKLPHKVLYHFPLIPRLQQLFLSKETACEMGWHKDKRVELDGVLRHPADAEGWKHFDTKFPWFAADPRNVRLSLALADFNLFENTSTSCNMWPVILTPYNLPPRKCMKETYLFMSLLIPGPHSPGKEIDVYLQPLIAELKQLWSVGFRTFDSYKVEYFQLHAALLWTINNFPSYGDLAGWNIKGDKACPVCNEDAFSMKLREGICYMGHRCYLPANHKWRKSKQHDGEEEHRLQPKIRNGEEIIQQVNGLQFSRFGKNPSKQEKKRKRYVNEINWTKKSIFFELPYWSKLMLRHKLDVMDIERSICENLVSTLLDIDGKTKDTWKARLDLEDLKIRKELHIQKNGVKYLKPHASYMLTADERVNFCKFLRSVTFPIGFASNISRCVNVKDGKIRGLKSYDFHVLIHRLLPIGIRPYLRTDICLAITEMSNFFRKLCAKTMRSQDLDKLHDEIVKILCKFEKIFPPIFFDVMTHLAIHLPHEAKIVGPVNYSCMYPIEQSLKTLEQYVKDKAHPESSFAEAYIINESLTFCSTYLQGVEARSNKNESKGGTFDGNKKSGELSVFRQNARLIGESKCRQLSQKEMESAHWYILNNCDESQSYLKQHASTLKLNSDISHIQKLQFPGWFKNRVHALHKEGKISNELYSLASGPNLRAHSYGGCIVNGLCFHTNDHDRGKTTQNSGVVVSRTHDTGNINFYGMLSEVLELHYLNERRVLLFKCEWFDTDPKKDRICNELGFISINVSNTWYKDCPFILASQAKQVFFLDDYKFGKDWKVVQFVQHRHLWDIPEIEDDEEDQSSEPSDLVLARNMTVDESVEFCSLNRIDVEPFEGNFMGMELNILDETTINEKFNEDELEDDDSLSTCNSDSFDALTSDNIDDEQDGGFWSL